MEGLGRLRSSRRVPKGLRQAVEDDKFGVNARSPQGAVKFYVPTNALSRAGEAKGGWKTLKISKLWRG